MNTSQRIRYQSDFDTGTSTLDRRPLNDLAPCLFSGLPTPARLFFDICALQLAGLAKWQNCTIPDIIKIPIYAQPVQIHCLCASEHICFRPKTPGHMRSYCSLLLPNVVSPPADIIKVCILGSRSRKVFFGSYKTLYLGLDSVTPSCLRQVLPFQTHCFMSPNPVKNVLYYFRRVPQYWTCLDECISSGVIVSRASRDQGQVQYISNKDETGHETDKSGVAFVHNVSYMKMDRNCTFAIKVLCTAMAHISGRN